LKKINITIETSQAQWLEAQVKTGKYASLSHAIRVAIQHLQKEEEKQ
jgi:Arc/MetJ-type ribon-helix-helix transcriptional regulator